MHLLFLRRVTPDLLCLIHNSTKFCMVIKLDESLYRVHLHPASGSTISVMGMLTLSLFAVANLLILVLTQKVNNATGQLTVDTHMLVTSAKKLCFHFVCLFVSKNNKTNFHIIRWKDGTRAKEERLDVGGNPSHVSYQ